MQLTKYQGLGVLDTIEVQGGNAFRMVLVLISRYFNSCSSIQELSFKRCVFGSCRNKILCILQSRIVTPNHLLTRHALKISPKLVENKGKVARTIQNKDKIIKCSKQVQPLIT